MTREEAIEILKEDGCGYCTWQSTNPYECENKGCKLKEALNMAIKALEQEPYRDMEEIAEIMKSDADAETKCKMISNILTAKPHYFEEQEPCDDAISREDAIKAECEACDICGNMRYTKCQYFMQGCNEVKCLRDLPSVTQKSGHWIWSDEIDRYVCDKCGQSDGKDKEMVESGEYPLSNYCPNCGARMVEPQESEDNDADSD